MAEPCKHTTRKGEPCPAPAITGLDACSAHSGRLKGDPAKARAAGIAKRKAARERAETAVELAKMGLDARLALKAAEHEEELAQAALDLALGRPTKADRQSLLALFDRVEGRPTQRTIAETAGDTSELDGLSMEELRRIASGGLRVIPGGAVSPMKPHSGMDKGIAGTS